MSEQTLTLDMSGLKDQLIAAQKDMVKQIRESMQKPASTRGTGQVVRSKGSQKLVESLRKVRQQEWKLEEQWTIAIPNYTAYELGAHLRDAVWVQELLKGEQGDVANIPWVGDVSYEQLGAVGNAFNASWKEGDLIGSVTTTLYEAGGWADLSYYLLERFDANLLDEVNKSLAKGAVNSEDEKIMTLINAGTSTNFAGDVTRFTASNYFYSTNIPQAIKLLMMAGKNADPKNASCT